MQTEARRERSGSSRVALVTALLAEQLPTSEAGSGRAAGARVLDCGGGSGAYAVPMALDGADVTVVDISADALATLRRRADEAGVSDRVHALAGDVEALGDLFAPGTTFDAVLAHGILDTRSAVGPVGDVFAAMADLVPAGGVLSVVVANPAAAVVARALAGEPTAALAELRRLDEPDPARVDADTVATWGVAAGLDEVARHGIGVFSDLVPGSAGETAGAREAVGALDAAAAGRAPFAGLAGRVHLVLRRP